MANSDLSIRIGGPFCIQRNNDTRAVEYPWAFGAAQLSRGLNVVEIGGALSGFQFVLARRGCHVTNVDPGEDEQTYWQLPLRLNFATVQRLNRIFGTDVAFCGTTLEGAQLPSGSVDRLISISTIEHIPISETIALGREIGRVMKPGGLCVLTIDLFLDLAPFTDKEENEWGRNIDVHSLVEASDLAMVQGDKESLVGFAECNTNGILRRLGEYFVGTGYPVCPQALVLTKN